MSSECIIVILNAQPDCSTRQKEVLRRNILNYNKSVSSGDDDEPAHFVKRQSHKMAVRRIHMTALERGEGQGETVPAGELLR